MPKVAAKPHQLNCDQQGAGSHSILIPLPGRGSRLLRAFQVAEYSEHFTCISTRPPGTGESDQAANPYARPSDRRGRCRGVQCRPGGIAEGSCGWSVSRCRGRPVAGWKYPDKVESLSAAQLVDKSDALPEVSSSELADAAKAVGVPEMIVQAIFPGASHRSTAERPTTSSSRCRRSSAAGRRSQCRTHPTGRVPFLLHDVEGTQLGDFGANPGSHSDAAIQRDVGAVRGSTDERHPRFRASHLEGCARGNLRERG